MITYKTLNKDINLTEKDNGYWDYETSYGDYVIAENKQSLRNGLIIACLTSWNYMNRKGNPTYETFGNRAYEELKKKKSKMVEYKIKQYFIEVLNRIRRVKTVLDIQVLDHPTDPNAYIVNFTVEATNDEIVKGDFPVGTEKNLSTSYITVEQVGTSTSPTTPVYFKVTIQTEYGNTLADEFIYAYRLDRNGQEVYLGVYKTTSEGISIPIYPSEYFEYEKVFFRFNGSSLFNGCESETYQVLSMPFFFEVDSEDDLYLIKESGTNLKIWLGEIVSSIDDIIYNPKHPNQCFLLAYGDDYKKYKFNSNGERMEESELVYSFINKPSDLQVGDKRLFIEDREEHLYMIDNHIWAEIL